MGSVGVPELIIIFTIALIIFGPRKLPELGKSLGKSLAEFKRASNELKSTLDEEIRSEERRSTERQEPPRVAAPIEHMPVDHVHVADADALSTGTDHSIGSVPRQNGSA
jgi:sec-independent protein translocase protein TatA